MTIIQNTVCKIFKIIFKQLIILYQMRIQYCKWKLTVEQKRDYIWKECADLSVQDDSIKCSRSVLNQLLYPEKCSHGILEQAIIRFFVGNECLLLPQMQGEQKAYIISCNRPFHLHFSFLKCKPLPATFGVPVTGLRDVTQYPRHLRRLRAQCSKSALNYMIDKEERSLTCP